MSRVGMGRGAKSGNVRYGWLVSELAIDGFLFRLMPLAPSGAKRRSNICSLGLLVNILGVIHRKTKGK
jgi:hypothetical protein